MPKCNFCDKKGLLIYPVRYAVACPAGAAGVPALSGNFKIEGAPQDIGTAKYTLRTLRAGYLYTYDEKRNRLKGYMVQPKGHLWNFPIEYMPMGPGIPFHCVDGGEVVRSHCVDVPHTPADPATNFWIGWSSVMWTKGLIKKAGDAAWRKKHMQCIDVPAMLAGGAKHTGEYKANFGKIAPFAAKGAAMRKAFSFSNTTATLEIQQHELGPVIAEIMATQAPHNKGFIVAVNDPVGITNDLSELAVPGLPAGFDEKMYHAKMVADLLDGAEKSVRAKARDGVVFSDELDENSKNSLDGGDPVNAGIKLWKIIKAGGLNNYTKQQEQDKQKYGADQAGRQNAAADHAWEELTHENGKPTLDEARLKSFPAEYQEAVLAFKPNYDKLINAHVDWLKSEQLANWMDGVHDATDISSGYAYSESVAQCVGKAVSTKPCADQLTAWLNSGKLSDTHNLYGRALLFNQNDIIAATEPHLKGSDIQFENILNVYKGALARVASRDAVKLVDRLALATANIIIKAISEGSYSVMRGLALAHLTLLGGVTIKASNVSAKDLSKWAIEQAKAQGIKLNTDRTQTRVDALKEAKSNVKKLPADRKLIAYELDIAQLERDERITAGSIRGIKVPGVDATQKWLGSSAPQEFHLGVVTAIVQLVALGFATQDLVNNDKFNQTETRTKMAMAIVSLGATIVDTVGSTVEKSTTHPMAVFLRQQWAVDVESAAKYAKGARVIGAAAGAVLGLFDILKNAPDAFGDGNETLGWLYRLNGALGIGIAIAAYFAIGAIFWPLLIVAFVVGIVIALVSSGLLKTWISRCEFSKGEKYPSFDDELKAYNHAVGA
ncbi:T6SS effector BTH_I2691 family protein [Collimonas pratensis]|uniref:Putative transmembrane protein n=1 Tax=Collimonas pratensis TaxID=279113 RepID=A0A127Q094_9BURK|nr:T6SS effector BTH_I2691 family protein [Collimonas pratensis]AMP03478.1 putative transmembrane protein [Collimonas pratensis]